MFIATLIAAGTLEWATVREAAHQITLAGGTLTSIEWLDEGSAADIQFEYDDLTSDQWPLLADALTPIGAQMSGPFDVVVQRSDGRQKRLLVADMDSTMITVECIDELADYAGLKPEIAAITERAMRGELDFEAALDARVALLADLDAAVIDRCLAERVTLMPGAKTLVRTMRARGARCVLVSGGFTRFAEPVAREIGFDRVIANRLVIADGKLTGAVERPIVGAAAKEQTLRAEAATLGIELDATLAVGDGANDLPMIRAAGLGVAFHAKPIVAAAAAARVEHNDLTALLWAQGIPRAEWVTSGPSPPLAERNET